MKLVFPQGEFFRGNINLSLDLELTLRFNIVFARERSWIEFYPVHTS
jgi:hypothetical protein